MANVSPDMFLTMVLSNPMTQQSQEALGQVFVAWFHQWLKKQGCYGIEVAFAPNDPVEIHARFRIQGMPNHDGLIIDVPVEGSPFELCVVSKVHTGCRLKEET